MQIQQFLTEVSTLAANTDYASKEGVLSERDIATAEIVVDGDRNEYRIIGVSYDASENKFHLQVEEEG